MDIGFSHRTKRQDSSIVPMINVVFLLMIFFLMSTTLAPETIEGDAPDSASGEVVEAGRLLVVSADGSMAWGPLRDDAAMAAIQAAWAEGTIDQVMILADRDVEGAMIARLMVRLGEIGVTDSALVTAGG